LAASNIRDYSRLQLIIEVLQRFVRVLSGPQREGLDEQISAYCAQTSGQQIYRLPAEKVPGELAPSKSTISYQNKHREWYLTQSLSFRISLKRG
jgi:hypothetical protein